MAEAVLRFVDAGKKAPSDNIIMRDVDCFLRSYCGAKKIKGLDENLSPFLFPRFFIPNSIPNTQHPTAYPTKSSIPSIMLPEKKSPEPTKAQGYGTTLHSGSCNAEFKIERIAADANTVKPDSAAT